MGSEGKLRRTDEELRLGRKSDAVKIKLAVNLRQETTMTRRWIAERLQMGACRHLNLRLYVHRESQEV